MTLFNKNFIKNLIDNYFIKKEISNYIYYDDLFYDGLSEILNYMIESPDTHKNCYIFYNNFKFININELLNNNDNLLEYQIFISFIYEILNKMQLLDYSNYRITNETLYNEIYNHHEFHFIKDLILELKFNNDIIKLTNQFKNI